MYPLMSSFVQKQTFTFVSLISLDNKHPTTISLLVWFFLSPFLSGIQFQP